MLRTILLVLLLEIWYKKENFKQPVFCMEIEFRDISNEEEFCQYIKWLKAKFPYSLKPDNTQQINDINGFLQNHSGEQYSYGFDKKYGDLRVPMSTSYIVVDWEYFHSSEKNHFNISPHVFNSRSTWVPFRESGVFTYRFKNETDAILCRLQM